MEFPNGYRVLDAPRSDARVSKAVAGPSEATVKARFRNAAEDVFFLSDWSWDRRVRGQSHFWIHPNRASVPAPQLNVLDQVRELPFPGGFEVVDRPATDAAVISKVEGPATANVKAYLDAGGIRFFMSDWSWEQMQKGGKANWMRPAGPVSPPPATRDKPPLPEGYIWSERTYVRVFEDGYEVVSRPVRDALPSRSEPGPLRIGIAADASGPGGFFFLTPDQNERRKRGDSYVWLRDIRIAEHPELIPRMRAFVSERELTFTVESYANRPWMISAELFRIAPEPALAAMREFGVAKFIPDMARFYEDREFPFAWLKEAARFLNEQGTLDSAVETLSRERPKLEKTLEYYEGADDEEMLKGYVGQRMQFNRRFLAILEAERGNFDAVEDLLSPLVAGWNPTDDRFNTSGPKLNSLREVARAQWILGKTESARRSTRKWIAAYTRDIANEILHPDYYSAAERFNEFDNDFEVPGDYFELLGAVTDPDVAAEIVIGLKGLKLAVASSTQARRYSSSDPELSAQIGELLRLEEEVRKAELAGTKPDYRIEDRIWTLRTSLTARRLSGIGFDFSDDPVWSRLHNEIERRRALGENEGMLYDLVQERDLISLKRLVEAGGFVVAPDDVRSCLSEGEVLVDFFRVPPPSFGKTGSYAAVVLPQQGDTRLVSLGSDVEIDAAVANYRNFMLGQGDYRLDSLDQLEEKVESVIASTAERILDPVLPLLEGADKLVLCPEGQVSFLPLDLLGKSAESLACFRWDITYVNSARDLARESPQRDRSDPVAGLVGNPAFRRTATGSAPAPGDRGWVMDETTRGLLAEASRGMEFAALPGTKKEIDALAPKLSSKGFRVALLAEDEATEANLVARVRSPALLHLATHGFFLPSLPLPYHGPEGAPKSGMLLSGLALCGAQNTLEEWNQGRIPLPGNDGILLASEVANLDLGTTSIVVLSACETAVGRTLSGEGVEGLRSGLTLAGARNVVLTLWPVDDEATVSVMNRFYDHLLSGDSPADSLTKAKRELFQRMSADGNSYIAHRFIGPFLLTRTGME